MNKIENIVLGGGCFWCIEAVFQNIDGIEKVTSGYAGGYIVNPTYENVCNGNTGHAEVVKIEFDNTKITLEQVLKIFFIAHDPTTLNQQGNDIGTQYRSAIFYSKTKQLPIINRVMSLEQSKWKNKIVTQVDRLDKFYEAEDYHNNYYSQNLNNSYCQFVIRPKLEKVLHAVALNKV